MFDAQWRERIAEAWKQVHDNTQRNRLRLVQLRAQGELSESESVERADLEEDVGAGQAAALVLRRSLIEKYPDSLPLRFAVARQLLQAGNPAGVSPMETLIETEPQAFVPGVELLRDYYTRRRQLSTAHEWHRRLIEHREQQDQFRFSRITCEYFVLPD